MPTPRVGVLVPPANPTVEPELTALLGDLAILHTARLPLLRDRALRERLAHYNEAAAATLESFGDIPLRVSAYACTGSSYLLGPSGDEALAEGLSRPGAPMVTAAGAVLAALRALGCREVTLVSPYPDWLTALSAEFWTAAGITVRAAVPVPGSGRIYDLGPAAALEAVDRRDDLAGPLLFTGTGMPTVEAVAALGSRWPAPVLSSAVCLAWRIAHALGTPEGGGAALPPSLAAHPWLSTALPGPTRGAESNSDALRR